MLDARPRRHPRTAGRTTGVDAGALTRWLASRTRPDEVGRRRLAMLLRWPLEDLDRIVGPAARPQAAPATVRWPRAGTLLQQRRHTLKLSRQTVASAAGVLAERLERWENGLSRPRVHLRAGLAQALQLRPGALAHILDADAPPDRRLHRIPQLAELRRVRGLTQKQLADLVGVTQSEISSWERRGVRSRDRPALSSQLRIDLRILLTHTDAEQPR